ncbi:MAG: transglutaminase-like domain-containing protein [Sedimentisphaerales bacterium]|nr:transglutaminase-like domain-containing protein [Sedimentisphaerales bacterium]
MRQRSSLLFGAWVCLVLISPVFSAQDEVSYFLVLLEGRKVGYAVQTRSVAAGQVRTSEQVYVSVNRVGVPVSLQMTETAIETTDGRPIGFESIQELSTMRIVVKGQIRPDGKLQVTTQSIGSEQTMEMDWPQDALLAEGLRLLTERHGLKAGVTYKATVFIPSLLQAVQTQVTIGPKKSLDILGTTMELTEVKTSMDVAGTGQMTTTSYVDDELRSHRTIMPMAGMVFEMVRCTEAVAKAAIDPVDLVPRMFLPSPMVIERSARARPICYLIRPKKGGPLPIPTMDTQAVRPLDGGLVEVTVTPLEPEGGRFPYDGDDPKLLACLQPNTFLQSNDKTIVELAKKAVGDANDATEAVRRIEQFVADYIEYKDLSIGYASAAEVAKTRQGDCTEHAVLAAAMCRAVGIPARVVTGIAYVERFGDQTNGFGGHAWVSTYMAGKWICIDPSFRGSGRGSYGSGHIALAVGDGQPSDFFNLAVLLGQFTIEQVRIAPGQ